MSRSQIESAIEQGRPFKILMADGKEYDVPHRDHVYLTPNKTIVVVADDEGHVWVLPLLTMTGISYRDEAAA